MSGSASPRFGLRAWIAVVIGWTAVALFFASYLATLRPASHSMGGDGLTWSAALRAGFTNWYPWILLTPLIFWLTARVPIDPARWPRVLLVHVVAAPLFSIAQAAMHLAVDAITEPFLKEGLDLLAHGREVLLGPSFTSVVVYAMVTAACYAVHHWSEARERQLRASQLETRLAEARLEVLRMQLDPHFLFNTLNSISALMHQDVAAADRMVARLGDLLRLSLDTAGRQEVALRQELEMLAPYLEIQQARFGPRLDVHLDVDPDALDALVPNLILQPLVENAVRHGVAQRSESGRVDLRARRKASRLELVVRDDGPGPPPGGMSALQFGRGLQVTRERLHELYGDAHSFELDGATGRGFEVRIVLPWRKDEGVAREASAPPSRLPAAPAPAGLPGR